MIPGIPLSVSMKELIENLRMRCKLIKSVTRSSKEVEEKGNYVSPDRI